MASRDIVNQMTDEMGMNQQMLHSMQQQQLSNMPMPGTGMGAPMASVDFSHMNPEQQQMMMMQQASMPPPQMMQPPPQVAAPPAAHPPVHDYDDSSSMTSSSVGSVEMDLDKLGLNGSHNKSFFDTILQYLKDPLVVIVVIVLISLTQFDSILKPMLPYGFVYGLYYTAIKALLGGLIFFVIKLAI
jgi:hypothetical protein